MRILRRPSERFQFRPRVPPVNIPMARSSSSRLCLFFLVSIQLSYVSKAVAENGAYTFGLDVMDGDLPIHDVSGGASSQQEAAGKTSWPELVGKDKLAAKAHLEQTTSKRIFLVPLGSVMTMDFSIDRVRILFDERDLVARTPRVG